MIKSLLALSLIAVFAISVICSIPSVNALPVAYNQTALNFGLTSVPRNSSSYDVFPLIPDNWLWEKFDNNTVDSGPLSVAGTVTYNSNLYGMFHFENVTTDDSVTHVSSTMIGSKSYVDGHEGKGFNFDGTNAIQLGTSGTYNYLHDGSQAWSISFWMKPSTTSPPCCVLLFDDSSFGNHQGVYVTWNGGQIYYQITNAAAQSIILPVCGSYPADTNWHHIVMTYDPSLGSNNGHVYLDGSLCNQSTKTANTPTAGNAFGKLTIGAATSGSNKFTGVLDEVRLYTNTALSQAQVSALYMVGHYSQSHTFDGGENVAFGSTSSFALLHNGSPYSLSLWLKESSAPAAIQVIEDTNNAGAANGMTLWVNPSGTIFYEITNNAGATVVSATTSGTVTFGASTWNYVGITYDPSLSSNNLKIYINNNVVESFTKTGNVASNTNSNHALSIGAPYTPNPFIGQIDNAKIYPYVLSSSQIATDQSLNPVSSGKQLMSWYHGVSGSPTLTKKLGFGQTTLTLNGNLGVLTSNIVSNNTNIYYSYGAAPLASVNHVDLITGTNTHDYSGSDGTGGTTQRALFMGIKHIFAGASDGINPMNLDSEKGNVTTAVTGNLIVSDQKILLVGSGGGGIKFNQNTTTVQTVSTNQCEINYNPTNTTQSIDNIACDKSIPAMAVKYWNGMNIQKIAGYNTNTTQTFLNSIDQSQYKKLLSLPCTMLGIDSPCITFILTDQSNTDYFIAMTSTHIYYVNAQTANNYLLHNNYGFQSYDIITQTTTSSYPIQNPILQGITLTGFNVNTTVNKAGLFTLPTGYYIKTTTIISAIRLIDPRWTDDSTDIPIITSTQSLFPIFLTVTNAPQFSAIKVTQGNQIINSQEAVWAIAQLDSTRSVEFDLPSGTCANTYIADISISPSIWNFEGIICASGLNQKTISYTNTLPLSFWTSKYSATHSYSPSSGTLTVTTRATTGPYTENIIIKNSNGTTVQNYTASVNGTIDTPSFNVTTVGKPLTLAVNINGNLIYTAFLGSAVSFASVSSFFATYFSYHGFNLLSLLPIIFAGMFTRNSVGIGAVAVVLLIASLNFFSLVVVPEAVITIMMFVSLLGMIAYRVLLY